MWYNQPAGKIERSEGRENRKIGPDPLPGNSQASCRPSRKKREGEVSQPLKPHDLLGRVEAAERGFGEGFGLPRTLAYAASGPSPRRRKLLRDPPEGG